MHPQLSAYSITGYGSTLYGLHRVFSYSTARMHGVTGSYGYGNVMSAMWLSYIYSMDVLCKC